VASLACQNGEAGGRHIRRAEVYRRIGSGVAPQSASEKRFLQRISTLCATHILHLQLLLRPKPGKRQKPHRFCATSRPNQVSVARIVTLSEDPAAVSPEPGSQEGETWPFSGCWRCWRRRRRRRRWYKNSRHRTEVRCRHDEGEGIRGRSESRSASKSHLSAISAPHPNGRADCCKRLLPTHRTRQNGCLVIIT
jgi:hypothetical protein